MERERGEGEMEGKEKEKKLMIVGKRENKGRKERVRHTKVNDTYPCLPAVARVLTALQGVKKHDIQHFLSSPSHSYIILTRPYFIPTVLFQYFNVLKSTILS